MPDIIYPEPSYQVQGAFFDVYNSLCHLGLSEKGWENALMIALADRGIAAERQVAYELHYKGYRVGLFYVDVIADGKLLIELKRAETLLPIDQAQVIAYLKVTALKLGILVNLGGSRLDFKRIPNIAPKPVIDDSWTKPSPTPANLLYPELTGTVRALLYTVHRELGVGFTHMHYRRAMQIALRQSGIKYTVKKEIAIQFRGQPIETHETRLLIVDDKILLAPIAVRQITELLKGRFRQYLRLFNLRLGLIANFHSPSLEIVTVRI
jgi:GxxExxY protein